LASVHSSIIMYWSWEAESTNGQCPDQTWHRTLTFNLYIILLRLVRAWSIRTSFQLRISENKIKPRMHPNQSIIYRVPQAYVLHPDCIWGSSWIYPLNFLLLTCLWVSAKYRDGGWLPCYWKFWINSTCLLSFGWFLFYFPSLYVYCLPPSSQGVCASPYLQGLDGNRCSKDAVDWLQNTPALVCSHLWLISF
jgi:hypothetical protein